MQEPTPRFWEIFFAVFETLPRQGPGNLASAAHALKRCPDLATSPAVLDLGCGVGMQTLYLAHLLPSASITALDNHAPNIERLQKTIATQGLAQRIKPVLADMAHFEVGTSRFDLIWSEGALYNIGISTALRLCHAWLHPHAYLVFTEPVWRKSNPPAKLKASFDLDYPDMGWVEDTLHKIKDNAFTLIDHFTLPDEAWWTDFYTPMQEHINALRDQYRNDIQAMEILEQLAEEPEMHRLYADYYAYELFVLQRG